MCMYAWACTGMHMSACMHACTCAHVWLHECMVCICTHVSMCESMFILCWLMFWGYCLHVSWMFYRFVYGTYYGTDRPRTKCLESASEAVLYCIALHWTVQSGGEWEKPVTLPSLHTSIQVLLSRREIWRQVNSPNRNQSCLTLNDIV